MTLSADGWLLIRFPDPTCGGTGTISVNLTPDQQCPDCQGSGLNENAITAAAARGQVPKWVLEGRTRFSR